MNFIYTLKLIALTLIYAALAFVVPIPATLQVPFGVLCAGVNIFLAFAWARIVNEEEEGFWFWACFLLWLIPFTRFGTMAALTVYSFLRAVWSSLKPLLTSKPSRPLETNRTTEPL